nr:hypothetical protein GCM10020092_039260 [Actinoplanes digitatis]
MRLAVVGNPGNRRVALFAAAAERAGLPAPRVYPWRDVLLSGRVPGPDELVRVDSPGEDAEVDRLLRELGSGRPAVPRPGTGRSSAPRRRSRGCGRRSAGSRSAAGGC